MSMRELRKRTSLDKCKIMQDRCFLIRSVLVRLTRVEREFQQSKRR